VIDADLLEILCCPETRQALEPASDALVAELNSRIARRQLRDRAGRLVEEPIEAGLVRKDQEWVYLVRAGIPVLLVDAALPNSRP
jgi:uncharacterized protein YbaR (Trm112 family)